jgi:hypothetical protein
LKGKGRSKGKGQNVQFSKGSVSTRAYKSILAILGEIGPVSHTLEKVCSAIYGLQMLI